MGDTLRVGMVGVGTISREYIATLTGHPTVSLVATADLDPTRAVPGIPARTPGELFAADDVDVVLNLTIPKAHAEVSLAAIAAGKHVYSEKPLAMSTVEGREILAAADRAGVLVGCAPDTVLGSGIQTARRCVDDGAVGTPVAATAFMVTPGHELWHPAPQFYYQAGGGPLYDMGPYYLTALVTLLGPVARVTGMAATPRDTRTVMTGPHANTSFPVEVATHVTGSLLHENGAVTTLMMSFDTWAANLPRIEVYGTAGSLSVPDPNAFTGDVLRYDQQSRQWQGVPALASTHTGRGAGIADLGAAVAAGEPHRASGELAYHVLDVMESLIRAAETGQAQEVVSTCARPAPVS